MNDALLIWGTTLWIAAIFLLFFAHAKALVWILAIKIALIHMARCCIPQSRLPNPANLALTVFWRLQLLPCSFRNAAFLLPEPSRGLRSSATRLLAILAINAYSLVLYLCSVVLCYSGSRLA